MRPLTIILALSLATPALARPPAAKLSVSLPDSTATLPPGPGHDAVAGNCLGCHSADFLTQQPKLPPATWAAEVTKMRAKYKAPVAESDVPADLSNCPLLLRMPPPLV